VIVPASEIVNIKVDKSKPPVIVPASEMVKQRVQTPDGKIHTIWVPPGHEVKEGAMLSESFFNNPRPLPKEAFAKSGSIKKSDIPEGEDVETYIQKTILANAYGVSMKEIESMIESGKIQLPSVVSRSPVEEFIDDDHLFHNHRNPSQDSWGEGINVPRGDRSTAGSVYTILDTDTPKVRSDIPLSLPDNTIVDEAARSNPISDLDKQLTPG
jgi:hypothetical protein